jgi:flagellar basal-body rod modification protein FlgD
MVEGIGARPMMSDAERARNEQLVNTINKEINGDKPAPNNVLDKNDFLEILITQLQNQDPTEPMKDKEFIAQMAQFSSLEQMTNMSENFSKLSGMINSSAAQNVLGKEVDITSFGELISGRVESVTSGDYPQVMVNGRYYDYSAVSAIKTSAEVVVSTPIYSQEIPAAGLEQSELNQAATEALENRTTVGEELAL